MAYGVIIYESEHDGFMSMSDENVGKIVKNMIRAFKGEEFIPQEHENAYSLSLYNRVATDRDKIVEKVVAGSKGGAPKGNKNASKNKQNNHPKQAKQPTETTKTTYNNNYNTNNNINKTLYKPNQFTNGVEPQQYNFLLLEKKLIKN
jgi:hypothetical protein